MWQNMVMLPVLQRFRLGIAGWLEYMLGVDDAGNTYELAPDPMNEEIQEQFKDIVVKESQRHVPIS